MVADSGTLVETGVVVPGVLGVVGAVGLPLAVDIPVLAMVLAAVALAVVVIMIRRPGGDFDDVSYISLFSRPSIFAAVETLEDAVVGSSQPTEPLGSAYNGRLRRSSRIEERARRKAKPRPGKAEKERSSKIRSRSEWERAPE